MFANVAGKFNVFTSYFQIVFFFVLFAFVRDPNSGGELLVCFSARNFSFIFAFLISKTEEIFIPNTDRCSN